jgi:hypothetical protein
MDEINENCCRCGTAVYLFSGKFSESDGSFYCIRCSEELDSKYLSKSICSLCTNMLDKKDVKIIMPSRLYNTYFFDKLPISNRLMCKYCFSKVNRLNLIRNPLTKIRNIRARLGKLSTRKTILGLNKAELIKSK